MRRAILLCIALLAPPISAAAQAEVDPDHLETARAAFEAGRTAYEAGEFEVALEHFREAHRLTGSPEILYNIATCADRLRRDEVALEAYRGYLAQSQSTPDRAQVQSRVRVLEEQIARAESERLARERREAEQAALREQLAARPDSPASPPPPPRDPGPGPWIVLAGGGAAAIAGVALVVVAELDAACVRAPAGCARDPSAPAWSDVADRYERIPTFQTIGAVLLGVGVAAMVAGLVWGVAGGGSDDATVELGVGPGGVALRGSFR